MKTFLVALVMALSIMKGQAAPAPPSADQFEHGLLQKATMMEIMKSKLPSDNFRLRQRSLDLLASESERSKIVPVFPISSTVIHAPSTTSQAFSSVSHTFKQNFKPGTLVSRQSNSPNSHANRFPVPERSNGISVSKIISTATHNPFTASNTVNYRTQAPTKKSTANKDFSVNPTVLSNINRNIIPDSKNIQSFSLGSAANINQNLLKSLNLADTNVNENKPIEITNITPEMLQPRNNKQPINTEHSVESNFFLQQQKDLSEKPTINSNSATSAPKNIASINELQGKITIQAIPNDQKSSLNEISDIDTIERLTIRDYLLSLNGKNGIVVLPMSSVLPKKAVVQQPTSILSQLTQYAIKNGLVDEHKHDQTSRNIITSKQSVNNDVAAIALGNTATAIKDIDNNTLNTKEIDTANLLKILSSLPSGNHYEGFSKQSIVNTQPSIALPESNLQVRDTSSSSSKRQDLFRNTLSDFFFVKGQWIGTLIGGLMDIGEVFSDAIRQISRAGQSTR